MGKTCTKDAAFARELRESEGQGSREFTKESSTLSRQQSVQIESPYLAPDVGPPHSVLKESIHDLSKTHRFYVNVYGIKARNLKVRSGDATTFCIVNWDDFAFERKTKKTAGGANPKWEDAMQFYWAVSYLAQLKERFLKLTVYEEVSGKSKIVGTTTVDIMTIASGPIHQDLRLFESPKQRSKRNEVGRLIFDIRVAQVCQLIIGPVEILVHIHESLDALDQLEVEGIGTKRPAPPPTPTDGELLSISTTSDCHLCTATQSPRTLIERAIDDQLTPAKESKNVPRTQSNDRSFSTLAEYSVANTSSLVPSDSFSTQLTSPTPSRPSIHSSLSLQQRRREEKEIDISGDGHKVLVTRGSMVEAVVDTKEDKEEVVDSVIERIAAGGHAESDELDPFVAEWQLTFIPTGVDNPVEYCSSWTPLCGQPYWNAVDHTVVDELTATELFALANSEDASESRPSSPPPTDETRALSESHSQSLIPYLSQLKDADSEPVVSDSLTPQMSIGSPVSPSNWQQVPSVAQDARTNAPRAGLKTTPISISEVTNALIPGDKKGTYPNVLQSPSGQVSFGPQESLKKSATVPPAVVLQSMNAQHLDHINPQTTYRKLAAICKRGRLVREMLYDDLPTIQLETTSDFLRQNHLKLRLYAKRLGYDSPKFYGEAWLPFFKIYDADIVEQMHHNFSDAYFHEKLWFEGKCIGHIEGVIVFQNNPMIRQMLAGVNTDTGFMSISPPILGAEHKSVKFIFRNQDNLPEEIRKLSQLHQNLLDILFSKAQHGSTEAALHSLGGSSTPTSVQSPKSRLGHLLHRSKHPRHLQNVFMNSPHPVGAAPPPSEFQGSHQELHAVCDQVLQTLRASHVETRRSFLYKQEAALLIGQRIFLNLASHVLEFADYVPWQYRSTYSAILHQTLRRGELDFGSCLPLPPEEIVSLSGEERNALHFAIKQVRKLANNNVRSLKNGSLSSRSSKLKEDSQKNRPNPSVLSGGRVSREVEKIVSTLTTESEEKVILYHRRMKFRREFLENTLTEAERNEIIPEWRGTEFELDGPTLKKLENWQPNSENRMALDWTPLLDALKSYFGADSLDECLKVLPKPPDAWRQIITSRGAPFFSFVEHWAKHVYQAIPHKQCLQWHMLPGYPTLLKAMLLEMKARDVPRSSVYNSQAVFASLNYVDYWIQVLALRDQPLPPNFDLRFLRRGLDIVLGSDIGLNIAKGLWFMYKNLPTFKDAQLKIFLIDLLFEKYFYILFLSWSWLVRRCFMWFLLYRVCETTRLVLTRDPTLFEGAVNSPQPEVKLLNGSPSPLTSSQLYLTNEEKVMVWGYLELSNFLAQMNGPIIFPKYLAANRLSELLLEHDAVQHPIESGRERSKSDWPTSNSSSNGSGEGSKVNPRYLERGAVSREDLLDIPTGGTSGRSSRHIPSMHEMIKRVKRLSENGDTSLTSIDSIPEEFRIYVNAAIPEFMEELKVYRNWVAGGADPLPTMNIPASPLDSNVDVPLENW